MKRPQPRLALTALALTLIALALTWPLGVLAQDPEDADERAADAQPWHKMNQQAFADYVETVRATMRLPAVSTVVVDEPGSGSLRWFDVSLPCLEGDRFSVDCAAPADVREAGLLSLGAPALVGRMFLVDKPMGLAASACRAFGRSQNADGRARRVHVH